MSVQERWIYKCDRCGMKASFDKGETPLKWMKFKGYDLCPRCKDKWHAIFENFLLSSEVEVNNAVDGE